MIINEYKLWLMVAIASTVFFVIKIIFMLFGGEGELDIEHSHGDSSEAFEILSIQSLVAFVMGSSWMGLTIRFQWEHDLSKALVGGFLFGLCILFLFSFLMGKVKRLNNRPHHTFLPQLHTKGSVYLTIPKSNEGMGKIQIASDGKLRILDAIQNGESPINSHELIEVIGFQNKIIIVQKTTTITDESN